MGGMLLMCQNTTVRVYGTRIKRLCFMFKTYSSSSSLVITSRWFATSRLRAPVSVRLVYYLSIPKLHRWSLEMAKEFHHTFYDGCNYLSMHLCFQASTHWSGVKPSWTTPTLTSWSQLLWSVSQSYNVDWSIKSSKPNCMLHGSMWVLRNPKLFINDDYQKWKLVSFCSTHLGLMGIVVFAICLTGPSVCQPLNDVEILFWPQYIVCMIHIEHIN